METNLQRPRKARGIASLFLDSYQAIDARLRELGIEAKTEGADLLLQAATILILLINKIRQGRQRRLQLQTLDTDTETDTETAGTIDWASKLPDRSGFYKKRDRGDKGPIYWIQMALIELSKRHQEVKSPGEADGEYFTGTAKSVGSFQKFAGGLKVDNDYGGKTRTAMLKKLGSVQAGSTAQPPIKKKVVISFPKMTNVGDELKGESWTSIRALLGSTSQVDQSRLDALSMKLQGEYAIMKGQGEIVNPKALYKKLKWSEKGGAVPMFRFKSGEELYTLFVLAKKEQASAKRQKQKPKSDELKAGGGTNFIVTAKGDTEKLKIGIDAKGQLVLASEGGADNTYKASAKGDDDKLGPITFKSLKRTGDKYEIGALDASGKLIYNSLNDVGLMRMRVHGGEKGLPTFEYEGLIKLDNEGNTRDVTFTKVA